MSNFILNQNLAVDKWDKFVKINSLDGGFLQSSAWADFQTANQRKIWRLAIERDQKIILVAFLVKQQLPFGLSYLYCPRGPVSVKSVLQKELHEALDFLIKEIKNLARTERAVFLRLEPAWLDQSALDSTFVFAGQVQPKQTLILDLELSEEKLLAQMKPKARYNIKVADKHGVFVELSDGNSQDFEAFWKLLNQTAQRDQISVHSKSYYQKMLKLPGVKLALARSNKSTSDEPVAGAVMAVFGEWCIYLHGASDYEYREQMAPYMLQWQMIKTAKKSGCRYYDFWGADEKKWPGVTRFKIGFSPKTPFVEYLGAYDLALNNFLYQFYRLSRRLRRR